MERYFAGMPLNGQTGHEAGRQLLAQLYREAVADALPPIAVTPSGKPYFPDSPWHFSITHTPRHAFCVLAKVPLGIDAEELDRKITPRLASYILSPCEQAQYDAAPDRQKALLTFWVLKEAAAKCTGQGIRSRPNKTNFSLSDSRVQEIRGCLVAIITQEDSHAF